MKSLISLTYLLLVCTHLISQIEITPFVHGQDTILCQRHLTLSGESGSRKVFIKKVEKKLDEFQKKVIQEIVIGNYDTKGTLTDISYLSAKGFDVDLYINELELYEKIDTQIKKRKKATSEISYEFHKYISSIKSINFLTFRKGIFYASTKYTRTRYNDLEHLKFMENYERLNTLIVSLPLPDRNKLDEQKTILDNFLYTFEEFAFSESHRLFHELDSLDKSDELELAYRKGKKLNNLCKLIPTVTSNLKLYTLCENYLPLIQSTKNKYELDFQKRQEERRKQKLEQIQNQIRYEEQSSQRTYIRGPKGGCYFINSKGNKQYVDRSFCN